MTGSVLLYRWLQITCSHAVAYMRHRGTGKRFKFRSASARVP